MESVPRALLVVALAGAAVCFSGTANHSLWGPDEPRVAEIGREMLDSSDFVVPTLGGEPFLEEPPLYWWGMAGLYRLFGVSDGVARSTSSLACFLLIFLVFDLTRRLANPTAGVMAALALATTTGFFNKGLRCTVDSWLALFVCLGYWGMVLALFPGGGSGEEPAGKRSALGILALYTGAGLAFLTKGPIGVALLGGPLLVAILWTKRWRFFASRWHLAGCILFLACFVLWPALLYARGGHELLGGFIVDNIIHRFLPPADGSYQGGHEAPFWYYFLKAPEVSFPWIGALPALFVWLRSRRYPAAWNAPALGFLACVFPLGIIFLSVPGTKRAVYALPLLAPLSCALGAWLVAAAGERASRLDRLTQSVFLLLVLILPAAIGGFALSYREKPAIFAWPPLTSAEVAGTLAWLGLLSVTILALWHHGKHLRKTRSGSVWPLTLSMSLILVVLYQGVGYPLLEPRSNWRRLPAELAAMGACEHTLLGYQLDEECRAIVPFYSGLKLKNLWDDATLERGLVTEPAAWLLTTEKRLQKLPPRIHSQLNMLRKWDDTTGRTRVYCLLEWLPGTGAPPFSPLPWTR